jgi:hypothetical protein
LFEDPEVQTRRFRAGEDCLGDQRQQPRADASALVPIGNVEVVEERPEGRVVVEEGVGESDETAVLGNDRAAAWIGLP